MWSRGLFIAVLLLAFPARAQVPATTMDIAPTLLRLEPGKAGLFYVTNRGSERLAVEIRPMDWAQKDGLDVLTSSTSLFASPPVVTIAPGARQSVRLLARRPGAWRLLVSELPDPAADQGRVKVMLQFSVPVFAGLSGAPSLRWNAQRSGDAVRLSVANTGPVPVKLAGAQLGGARLMDGPLYLLAGSQRDFMVRGAATMRLTAQDALSGHAFDTDVAP